MRRSLLVFGECDDWKTPAVPWPFCAKCTPHGFRRAFSSCRATRPRNRGMNIHQTTKRSRHSCEWTKSSHVSILPVSGLQFLLRRAGVPSIKALRGFAQQRTLALRYRAKVSRRRSIPTPALICPDQNAPATASSVSRPLVPKTGGTRSGRLAAASSASYPLSPA